VSHKVLFVDDQYEVTNALKRALRNEPYEILVAHSADEALTVMQHQTVDVIVSDEKMPGMSGTELLEIVSRQYPDTIRMMLTGAANLMEAVRAINSGQINHFFTKPQNDDEIMQILRQTLGLG